jgi:hypothetical protein
MRAATSTKPHSDATIAELVAQMHTARSLLAKIEAIPPASPSGYAAKFAVCLALLPADDIDMAFVRAAIEEYILAHIAPPG